ncbi:hypothetical protein ACIRJR_18645 [Streptomyces sp. NPDC102402]|uniref:hypothetical protein n=1 Tax=Streptomyces sp. NPDC102402 TaxID=3366169 RepID=UPI00381AF070
MDSYDSHHARGRGREPESSTPIYDRLLAEWRDAARREAVSWAEGAAPAPEASGEPSSGRESAFVPAARTAGGCG